jgi:hypothetical protein
MAVCLQIDDIEGVCWAKNGAFTGFIPAKARFFLA